jgi:hypothetical protein
MTIIFYIFTALKILCFSGMPIKGCRTRTTAFGASSAQLPEDHQVHEFWSQLIKLHNCYYHLFFEKTFKLSIYFSQNDTHCQCIWSFDNRPAVYKDWNLSLWWGFEPGISVLEADGATLRTRQHGNSYNYIYWYYEHQDPTQRSRATVVAL